MKKKKKKKKKKKDTKLMLQINRQKSDYLVLI